MNPFCRILTKCRINVRETITEGLRRPKSQGIGDNLPECPLDLDELVLRLLHCPSKRICSFLRDHEERGHLLHKLREAFLLASRHIDLDAIPMERIEIAFQRPSN